MTRVEECHNSATKLQAVGACPHCGFSRAWALRRGHRTCKRCRKEWSPIPRSKGFRASRDEWKSIIRVFLRERTGVRVAEDVGIERRCVHRMLHHLRTRMTEDRVGPFSGIVEIDETLC